MVVNRFFRVRRRGVWGNALRSEGGGVMRGGGVGIYYLIVSLIFPLRPWCARISLVNLVN